LLNERVDQHRSKGIDAVSPDDVIEVRRTEVEDASRSESYMHHMIGDRRLKGKDEIFAITLEKAVAVMAEGPRVPPATAAR
jgi:hypothetical protein